MESPRTPESRPVPSHQQPRSALFGKEFERVLIFVRSKRRSQAPTRAEASGRSRFRNGLENVSDSRKRENGSCDGFLEHCPRQPESCAIGAKLGGRVRTPSGAARGCLKGGGGLPPLASPCGPGTLPYSFPKFQAGIIAPPESSLSFSRNPNDASHEGSHEQPVPVSAQAATIIIDGNTIDIDGVRIRIAQINTAETFRPRCENELIFGLKAKKRLRQLLDSGTVPRKHHGGIVMKPVIAIAMSMALLAPSVAWPVQPQSKPLSRGNLARRHHRRHRPASRLRECLH